MTRVNSYTLSVAIVSLSLLFGCNNSSQGQSATPVTTTTASVTISEVEETQTNYELELVAGNLDIPWGMVFVDGKLLVSEKKGTLWLYEDAQTRTAVTGVPETWQKGQGGLLDIEIDPNYGEEPWLYFSYSKPDPNDSSLGHTAIGRAQLVANELQQWEELYYGAETSDKGFHFGSRIEFDDQQMLYFSIGDRGDRDNNPQDPGRDGGKIYRIHKDGSIPTDNPFYGQSGAKEAVFSYGHRNPQGMIFHPEFKEIWVHEHGPQGGDEVNSSQAGKNFGWPVISYGINYDGSSFTDITEKEGMEQPLYYWVPSIAPSGMQWVTSERYPELNNTLLVGSLKFQYLEALHFEGKKAVKRERLFKDIGRLRTVRQGPEGYLYIAVEGKGIYRVLSS